MPGPEPAPIDPTEFSQEGFDPQLMRPRKPTAIPRWVSIVGARPQFIKLAPLCRAIADLNLQNPTSLIEHQIIHTGQHYDRDVAGIFFDQMEIPHPNFNLWVGSGSAGTQIARMLARMESILAAIQPDWVIVYGDTNSTLAGALLAARLNIPLAHVESGCRSGQISQPEEQNRIVADQLSQVLFSASENDARNLCREGIGTPNDPLQRRSVLAGDILFDALLQNSAIAELRAEEYLHSFPVSSKNFYLLTIHRPQNTDDPERLQSICRAASHAKDSSARGNYSGSKYCRYPTAGLLRNDHAGEACPHDPYRFRRRAERSFLFAGSVRHAARADGVDRDGGP